MTEFHGIFSGEWSGRDESALGEVFADVPIGLDGFRVVAAYLDCAKPEYDMPYRWFVLVLSRSGRLYAQSGFVEHKVEWAPEQIPLRRFAASLRRGRYGVPGSHVVCNGLRQALFCKDIVE